MGKINTWQYMCQTDSTNHIYQKLWTHGLHQVPRGVTVPYLSSSPAMNAHDTTSTCIQYHIIHKSCITVQNVDDIHFKPETCISNTITIAIRGIPVFCRLYIQTRKPLKSHRRKPRYLIPSSFHTVAASAWLTSIAWIHYDVIWPIGSLFWRNSSGYSEATLIQWNDTFYKSFGLNVKQIWKMAALLRCSL